MVHPSPPSLCPPSLLPHYLTFLLEEGSVGSLEALRSHPASCSPLLRRARKSFPNLDDLHIQIQWKGKQRAGQPSQPPPAKLRNPMRKKSCPLHENQTRPPLTPPLWLRLLRSIPRTEQKTRRWHQRHLSLELQGQMLWRT